MRRYIAIVLIILSAGTNAQNLTFSSEIETSQDVDIKTIAHKWSSYFNACANSGSRQETDSINNIYWNQEEISVNLVDIIQHSSGYSSYKWGSHFTYNIRKITDGLYEINTIQRLVRNNSDSDIPYIYKICAKKVSGEYKFFNYFYFHQDKLRQSKFDGITYYYPHSYSFTKSKVRKVLSFIEKMSDTYALAKIPEIRYVIGQDLDDCSLSIGYTYTIARSEKKYAGLTLNPNIILSCRIDHLHEITHSLISSNYPSVPLMISEGMATYYGGTGVWTNREHVDYIRNNLLTAFNWSDFDSYFSLIDGKTNPFYTVGFLLIDYTLKIGGVAQVKRLLEYKDIDEVFKSEYNLTDSDSVNSFIYNLIMNYTDSYQNH